MKILNSIIILASFILLAAFSVAADSENKGMLVQFQINPDNSHVLSTQNISLPVFDQAYLPIGKFPAKAAFFPVGTFSTTDEQFKLLGSIGKSVPSSWNEKDTTVYMAFKAKLIKPETYLLELSDDFPSSKQLGDLKDRSFLYLPTQFASEQELKDSELYKILKASHNPALAKEITAWADLNASVAPQPR